MAVQVRELPEATPQGWASVRVRNNEETLLRTEWKALRRHENQTQRDAGVAEEDIELTEFEDFEPSIKLTVKLPAALRQAREAMNVRRSKPYTGQLPRTEILDARLYADDGNPSGRFATTR